MIIWLAFKNIFHKPLHTILNIIIFATGIGIITMLSLVQRQFEDKFEKNIEGIDMVMGASGSPLQLILSAVYHIDAPTGNISLEEAEKWMHHPYIAKAVPMAYGDSYMSFPMIGSDRVYYQHFSADLSSGKLNEENYEVVVGSEVVNKLKLKLGDKFHSTHGQQEGGEEHDDIEWVVTGILKPTGKVIDRMIISNIESVWDIHGEGGCTHDHEEGKECHHHGDEGSQEITAVLLKYRNPMAAMQLPRLIKEQSKNIQLAQPAIEINRLFSLLGIGLDAIRYLAYFIMGLSAISIFISIYNTLKERMYELAMIRTLGGSKLKVFSLILSEGILYSIFGYFAGFFLGIAGYKMIAMLAETEYQISFGNLPIDFTQQSILFGISLFIGFLAALFPALKSYFIQISSTLAHE
jgi:putative ABC transport system permease protein